MKFEVEILWDDGDRYTSIVEAENEEEAELIAQHMAANFNADYWFVYPIVS